MGLKDLLVLYILLPYLFRGIQETLLSYKTNVTDYITSDSNFWILIFNLNFFLKVRYKVSFSLSILKDLYLLKQVNQLIMRYFSCLEIEEG